MHKDIEASTALVDELIPGLEDISGVEKVLCPPYTSLAPVSRLLGGTSIGLGAQNMHWKEEGAFTGEVSPLMLTGLVKYVIIGHSERRTYFGETDETVNRRVQAALAHDLIPILCVGETLQENEAGETRQVVSRQVRKAFAGVEIDDPGSVMLAYEPVWAIGTGKAATPHGANGVIADVIRPELAESLGSGMGEGIRILYGGSVKSYNAKDFFVQSDIDGALVGGASLQAQPFIEITQAAA